MWMKIEEGFLEQPGHEFVRVCIRIMLSKKIDDWKSSSLCCHILDEVAKGVGVEAAMGLLLVLKEDGCCRWSF